MLKDANKNFSYKLDIALLPHWGNICKKVYNPKSEKEWNESVEEKIKKMKEEGDTFSLWGRRYYFTEYYDSASGLITRFQGVGCENGKQYFSPVDEFGDLGYIFESDKPFGPKQIDEQYKLSIKVSEDSIYHDVLDRNIGGEKVFFEKDNCLFKFPLSDVFNFLFTLGQHFKDAEGSTVIKWPDFIEQKFKELNIKYELYLDYEPVLLDIEKQDKDFFNQIGKPKIADSFVDKGFLESNEATYYIKLKIFRPGENDRINESLQEDELFK
jgi:hypothetical protein